MTRRKSNLAFSLVDIMVYMAILAVVIGLAFAGINIVQRSGRDQERRVMVQSLITEANNYFHLTSAYPAEPGTLKWGTDTVTIGAKVISLPGFKQYSATTTDSQRTRYTYLKDRSGFVFCAKLEDGSWFRSGPGGDTLKCPTN